MVLLYFLLYLCTLLNCFGVWVKTRQGMQGILNISIDFTNPFLVSLPFYIHVEERRQKHDGIFYFGMLASLLSWINPNDKKHS